MNQKKYGSTYNALYHINVKNVNSRACAAGYHLVIIKKMDIISNSSRNVFKHILELVTIISFYL